MCLTRGCALVQGGARHGPCTHNRAPDDVLPILSPLSLFTRGILCSEGRMCGSCPHRVQVFI